jgi:protein NUD1
VYSTIASKLSTEEESEEEEMESPSLKTSASSKPRTGDFHPLTERTRDSTRETSSFNRDLSRRTSVNGNGNATFLTECSFGVARDRLVEVITDVQPFEPHWEDLACIDLSEKRLESVARLKELLPRLHELIL